MSESSTPDRPGNRRRQTYAQRHENTNTSLYFFWFSSFEESTLSAQIVNTQASHTSSKQYMQTNICQGIKTIVSTNKIYAKEFINHSYVPGVYTYSPIHHSYGPGVYMPRIFDKKCKPRKDKTYKKYTKSNACHKDTLSNIKWLSLKFCNRPMSSNAF